MNRSAVGWLLLAAVLWGTTGTAQALGEAEGSPLTVGAIRLAIGSLGLLAVGGRTLRRPPLGWLLVGSVAMALYQVSFFTGVARAGVTLGTVVALGTAPIVAGILGRMARSELLGPRWWGATGLAVLGVVLIGGRPGSVDLFGLFMAVTAGVAYATTALAAKYLVEAMPPTSAMAAMFGLAALLLAPLIPGSDLSWLTTGVGLSAALWLGLGATTLAYIAFARGLTGASVGQAATMGLAEPATATLLGVLLLAERPPTIAWVGVALVVGALLTLSRPQRVPALIP